MVTSFVQFPGVAAGLKKVFLDPRKFKANKSSVNSTTNSSILFNEISTSSPQTHRGCELPPSNQDLTERMLSHCFQLGLLFLQLQKYHMSSAALCFAVYLRKNNDSHN